jgi:hypothetical protein
MDTSLRKFVMNVLARNLIVLSELKKQQDTVEINTKDKVISIELDLMIHDIKLTTQFISELKEKKWFEEIIPLVTEFLSGTGNSNLLGDFTGAFTPPPKEDEE